ncbi:MAG: alpha-glucosidase/alpha-galactosidase [Phototrophicaceae bacterium]|nr:MAG: glycoside hydrolase family protein [Chloroflexi bacterium OLB13]MBV6434925.1 Alpha-galactosidase [Anaerolineae bacterium]MBW7877986.1 alpha-glucosidase/alpha-galactosidase [Anaerolineae bacterium]MEB2364897.1 alpha-glucosidase/alpha-galactosidase [Chloroflexota bacterium]OQY81838.1 MAG: alpha-glucosidase/alpha-galactosidase [Anaerolineae bacterium UTCFX5]
MARIALIGAGSTVFARNLLGDILSFPELADSDIRLMDIDPYRLHTSEIVAHKVAEALSARPAITATTDRRQALQDADYVICMIQVGGYKPGTVIDFEIPKKYGLRQTIADTLGIGGIMRGLRTIPVLLDITRDMEEVCPDALFINYVNPMCMNQWALDRGSKIANVGLCHSVPHTAQQLAADIGVPYADINYLVAGINHLAFYLKFEHKHTGQDLYPLIRKVVEEHRVPDWNRVRYELFTRVGYFVTESSEHLSEYTPYFIKRDRPDLIEQYNIPLDEYIRRCEAQIAGWEALRAELEDRGAPIHVERSGEYGSLIIHSMETGVPRVIYGNVANHGIIDNLPQGCAVEVPCLVDQNGIQPTRIGAIPPQLAALMQTNVNVQSLTVEAALTGKREHIYHAAMLDPHTAAELTLDQIWALVDDLIEAHGSYLPEYA